MVSESVTTQRLFEVITLPCGSSRETTGWVAKAIFAAAELDGDVVNASFEAAAAVIVKELLTALVNPVALAVRV